jgi:hypothetical protein
MQPLSSPTQGGVKATLSGSNFGLGLPAFYTLRLGSTIVSSSAVSSFNHTHIIFTIPRGQGANLGVSIVVSTQPSTYLGQLFSYLPPAISGAAGCPEDVWPSAISCQVQDSWTLTVRGANFGNNASALDVVVASVACTSVVLTSTDTELTCTMGAHPTGGFNMPVVVTLAGQSDSKPYVSFIGPSLYANTLRLMGTPASSSTGHISLASLDPVNVTFEGRFFGSSESDVTIHYGLSGVSPKPYTCTVVPGSLAMISGGNSTISCTTSVGIGAGLVFVLQSELLVSPEGVDTLSYPAPVILPNTIRGQNIDATKSNEYTGQFSEGDVIFFGVANVGSDASMLEVRYDKPGVSPKTQQCTGISLFITTNGTVLRCTTSPGVGKGFVFQVRASNAWSAEGTDVYNYVTAPAVERVSGCTDVGNVTTNCPTVGGNVLTLYGRRLFGFLLLNCWASGRRVAKQGML